MHEKQISDLKLSVDGTHFITASADKTAKLVDTQTLEVLKTYQSDRPMNSADISPIFDHVVVGGGQEASQASVSDDFVSCVVTAGQWYHAAGRLWSLRPSVMPCSRLCCL